MIKLHTNHELQTREETVMKGSRFALLLGLCLFGMTLSAKAIDDTQADKMKAEYIRPGFTILVDGITIGDDLRPEVHLRFVDDKGQALDRAGLVTLGSISTSFILTYYHPATRDHIAYTVRTQTSPFTGVSAVQASSDSGGSWTDTGLGSAIYKFGTALPADYDVSATHRLAVYGNRNLQEELGETFIDNVVYDFRPDGGSVVDQWQAVSDETCNKCHSQLAFHGGQRQDVGLCVTCHNTTQSLDPDTGNSVDMKVMIHKIHMGHNLPSVMAGTPYQIIGHRNTVHDYSHVTYPQDIRNCTTCHEDASPEGHIWYSRPSRMACGSCHDDVDFAAGHAGVGPQLDDQSCANCHAPVGDLEFDASIMGAHTIPTKSNQLLGLKIEVLSVTQTEPGQFPVIDFVVSDRNDNPIDPATLDRFNFLVAGPNDDFETYFSADGRSAAFNGSSATLTLTTPIPEGAVGSWTLSADVYKNVVINPGTDKEQSVREAALNPIVAFAVTDATPVPRRESVSLDKCNACHDTLALHGGQRYMITECAMCHHPSSDDASVRPEEAGLAESIHFKRMIHRIHAGEHLQQDLTIYGYRSSVHNYNEVVYPGNLADCMMCHVNDSHNLPVPAASLPTITLRDYYTPQEPTAAACLGCHDSIDAAAHAWVNTATFGEACDSCHGVGKEFSVESVHGLQ
jgi:OmcA/MtrC family decaheme c-type cytochrome